MVKIITIICCVWISILADNLFARILISGEMTACRNIEIALGIDFISQGKSLPKSWDEFSLIQRIRHDGRSADIETVRGTNALAIVPGSPALGPDKGISPDRSGMRLFAISRNKSEQHDPFTSETSIGRCVILVADDGTDVMANWILENEALLMLSQLPEFNPLHQELAFDENFIQDLASERKIRNEQSLIEIQTHHGDKIARQEKDHPPLSVFAADGKIRWMPVAVTFLLLSLLAILVVTSIRRNLGK